MEKHYHIGYTQGVFDMFHIGHLNLLNHAKECCDILLVGVNADALVQEYKHKTPVIREDQRLAIVRNIKSVDDAFLVYTLDKRATLGGDILLMPSSSEMIGKGTSAGNRQKRNWQPSAWMSSTCHIRRRHHRRCCERLQKNVWRTTIHEKHHPDQPGRTGLHRS